MLRDNLKSRDKDMEELRVEASLQSDLMGRCLRRYRRCSQVIALISGVRVESAGGWLEGANRDPEGPNF